MIPVEEGPMALAERQAELDRKLLATLKDRAKETGASFVAPDGGDIEDWLATEEEATERFRAMSRSERRQAVQQFAAKLRLLPRARPVVNPTILPKSKRRRRKGHRV